ncbi:hypothetical protein QUA74_00435 [Microcoleus sp. LAD1_D3]|uniref:hypothetical protein n=1 Tax=Microcoleus sp. LAD1_D5 TaxID=2818813 RepID=UPI002FD6BF32
MLAINLNERSPAWFLNLNIRLVLTNFASPPIARSTTQIKVSFPAAATQKKVEILGNLNFFSD